MMMNSITDLANYQHDYQQNILNRLPWNNDVADHAVIQADNGANIFNQIFYRIGNAHS